jgi:hypothetical protein
LEADVKTHWNRRLTIEDYNLGKDYPLARVLPQRRRHLNGTTVCGIFVAVSYIIAWIWL